MYITVNRKVIAVDEERSPEERRRIASIMRANDKRQKAIENDKKRRGYCLDCHILLTVYGKCSKCGTVWSFHKTQH